MELNEVIKKVNSGREKLEAAFVFSLWKDPTLYDDYRGICSEHDKTLQNQDAIFYFLLGRALRNQGYNKFDNITVDTYLSDKPETRKQFASLGGWTECEKLMSLVDTDNVGAVFDKIAKANALSMFAKKYDEMFSHVERFDQLSSEDVYNAFDLLNNSIALTSGNESKIEDLLIDEGYIKKCDSGLEVGLNFSKACPLLNYNLLGIPVGDISLIGASSGVGKSSFVFENFIIPIAQSGTGVAIISNEMVADAYKNLLIIHVLCQDLNYWGITRRKLKIGGFNDEQKEMLRKAADIIKQKYSNIRIVKMFQNDINIVVKYINRLARTGSKLIVYDTMKSNDKSDVSTMWQDLLLSSRRIFNAASKNNVAIVATFQLALYAINQRWLDASILSNSKQVKECVSMATYMRPIWQDEYTGEKYDIKPYVWDREKKVKRYLTLDKDKKYIITFIDKSRNGETGITIVYQWNSNFNHWKEIGYCTVVNDHNQKY